MTTEDTSYWIEKLELLPHPEGGFFKETYRSTESVLNRDGNKRSASTGIYFLMEDENFSAFHRIQSDEMWHYYKGAALSVYMIKETGELEILKIGDNPEKGEVFQAVVPAGVWFASRVEFPNTFSLVGCTVAPGFDFEDFELANREELIKKFPQYSKIITELTRV